MSEAKKACREKSAECIVAEKSTSAKARILLVKSEMKITV